MALVENCPSPTPASNSPNTFSSPRPTRPLRTTNIAVQTSFKPSSLSSHRVQAASRISQTLTNLALSDGPTSTNAVSTAASTSASLSQVDANVMARSIKTLEGKQNNNYVASSTYGPERHFDKEPATTQSARDRPNPYPMKASSRQTSHTSSIIQQAFTSPVEKPTVVGAASQPALRPPLPSPKEFQPTNLPWATAFAPVPCHKQMSLSRLSCSSPRCQPLPETIHEKEDPQQRYELQTIIRDSIFGKVFAGVDKKTGQKVAIKLSNLQLLRSGRSVNGRPVLENPIHESAMMRKICPVPTEIHSHSSHSNNNEPTGHLVLEESLTVPTLMSSVLPRFFKKEGSSKQVHIHKPPVVVSPNSVEPIKCSPFDDKITSSTPTLGEKSSSSSPTPQTSHPNVLPLLAEYMDGQVHWMVMPLMQGELFDEVRRIPRPSARHLQAHRRSMIQKPHTALVEPNSANALSHHSQSDSKVTEVEDHFNPFNHIHTAACNFVEMQARFQLYFREMVEGLSFIHTRGFCHLDFSLENILIDEEGRLRVSDFGVARELPAEGSLLLGFRHEKPGKLRYMAPEVLLGQAFDGKKADSFGLGVTLFCMLTAHPPFEMPAVNDPGFALVAQGNLAHLLRLLRVDHLVTVKAYEVLNGLLCPDWNKRWSLDQVKSHAYFCNDIVNDDEESVDMVLAKVAGAQKHQLSARPEGLSN